MSAEEANDQSAELEQLLTRENLAEAWQTSVRTIDRYIASGELEVVRIGRSVRIRPSAAMRLLSKLSDATA
jgi:excisionase family DNA binding protein